MISRQKRPWWTWLVIALALLWLVALVRSIAIYYHGRHELDRLEAALDVGMTREEAFAAVRTLGYTAYGPDPSREALPINHFHVYYDLPIAWPTHDSAPHMLWADVFVPIGGVICDKRAVLSIEFDYFSDLVSRVREEGPELRCWLPVVPVYR